MFSLGYSGKGCIIFNKMDMLFNNLVIFQGSNPSRALVGTVRYGTRYGFRDLQALKTKWQNATVAPGLGKPGSFVWHQKVSQHPCSPYPALHELEDFFQLFGCLSFHVPCSFCFFEVLWCFWSIIRYHRISHQIHVDGCMKSEELTTSEIFRCFRFLYKCLALKTSILHRCATLKSVSSSAARIEGAFFRWKKYENVHFSCKTIAKFPIFLCFGDVKTGGSQPLKHDFIGSSRWNASALQRQGTSPKDWRLIEDLWGTKASRRWGLEGLLSVPCFFGDLVKDLKVSKPTIKMLALVFLWSCASAEARHWALWVALMAENWYAMIAWFSNLWMDSGTVCPRPLSLWNFQRPSRPVFGFERSWIFGWLDGRNLKNWLHL